MYEIKNYNDIESIKQEFYLQLNSFTKELKSFITTEDGSWLIKGFIDTHKDIYTLSDDTKIISKVFEIHILPQLFKFAELHEYSILLPEHQNYYPDLSFISNKNKDIKFALDFKTTYKLPMKHICNGFTLGSHGEYFQNRKSSKNIQFPYSSYLAHFCLGIIYERNVILDKHRIYSIQSLNDIPSVAKNFIFFVTEKWKIASDRGGSGNTANIGSITNITDLINGRGMFSQLGEKWFDDYWINYGKVSVCLPNGDTKKITNLRDFVLYRNGDIQQIVSRRNNII